LPISTGVPLSIDAWINRVTSIVMRRSMVPQNRGMTHWVSSTMMTISTTAAARISLSVVIRCSTIVAAKPALNGSANWSMGTAASTMYLAVWNGPMRSSPARGLIAAPNAITITSTAAQSAKTRSSSPNR
jgi:hypothetical protein